MDQKITWMKKNHEKKLYHETKFQFRLKIPTALQNQSGITIFLNRNVFFNDMKACIKNYSIWNWFVEFHIEISSRQSSNRSIGFWMKRLRFENRFKRLNLNHRAIVEIQIDCDFTCKIHFKNTLKPLWFVLNRNPKTYAFNSIGMMMKTRII